MSRTRTFQNKKHIKVAFVNFFFSALLNLPVALLEILKLNAYDAGKCGSDQSSLQRGFTASPTANL
jgi:hypothetical protein